MKPGIELPGFDLQDALDRFGGDSALLLKYVALMIKDFEQRLPTLAVALVESNFDAARIQLHTMAGTASALSATDLIALCLECESLCEQSLQAAALKRLAKIEHAMTKVRRCL